MAIAKANSKLQTEPVQLAPPKGFGEVSWKTPIEKNAIDVPIKEKVDLLMAVNAAAMKAGANFINSPLFQVNEQKYFASTDGSYIDQDVHRIWPTFTVTAIDKATGKFQTRDGLSAPVGMGWEYLTARAGDKITLAQRRDQLRHVLRHARGRRAAGKQALEKLHAPSRSSPANTTWCSIPRTSA